jgi:hypothetical protein
MIVPPNDSADSTTPEPKSQPATENELATQRLPRETAVKLDLISYSSVR